MKYYIDFIIQNNDDILKKYNIQSIYKKDKSLNFSYDKENIKINIKKNNIIMNKENDESIIIFNFILGQNTETKYYLKNFDSYLDTRVLTNKLIIEEKKIYIEYELWLQEEYIGSFKYQINIKEM